MSLARRADPIVAVATAAGRAAIGIVRLSGFGLAPLAQALCGAPLAPRVARLVPFLDAGGVPIDRGLALFFPAPHSTTGEDVLELQAHGGPVLLQLLVARCLEAAAEVDAASGAPRLAHLRIADPGEFTERAYLNDKLDLAQAEAVMDLIDAGTATAARSAARSLEGVFSQGIEALRERLVELRMLVEATLDFPDEEAGFLERADARGRLAAARAELAGALTGARRGALLRDGIRVVIVGQPNAGKSSLLNALAGAERAIVTPIAGTTRDAIGESIEIDGVPLHVLDTAGLRQSSDEVERIGIERAWQAAAEADAIVFVHDLGRRGEPAHAAEDARLAGRLAELAPGRIVHVDNKADLVEAASPPLRPAEGDPPAAVRLSARTGAGLDALRHELLRRAGWSAPGEGEFSARARHVDALQRAGTHLAAANAFAERGDGALELFAEELRSAHDALAEITGAFSADDLLGVIFGRFCIGK